MPYKLGKKSRLIQPFFIATKKRGKNHRSNGGNYGTYKKEFIRYGNRAGEDR